MSSVMSAQAWPSNADLMVDVHKLFPQEGTWQGMWNLGKRRAGRELDGRTWDEFPKEAS